MLPYGTSERKHDVPTSYAVFLTPVFITTGTLSLLGAVAPFVKRAKKVGLVKEYSGRAPTALR